MEPRDAALLLDGISFTAPNQAAELFCQVQDQSQDERDDISKHLSNHSLANTFKKAKGPATPEVSREAQSRGRSSPVRLLSAKATADCIKDLSPKAAAKLLVEQTSVPNPPPLAKAQQKQIINLVEDPDKRSKIRDEVDRLVNASNGSATPET